MADCIFCKIRDGEIPAKLIQQDADAFAFHDINPQAPLHALVVPRRHIASAAQLSSDDNALVGHLFQIANQVARDAGVADAGYRLVVNCGAAAGQTVYHLHLHVIGGRTMSWPP
jgi:histidine triad (HIT) family protein